MSAETRIRAGDVLGCSQNVRFQGDPRSWYRVPISTKLNAMTDEDGMACFASVGGNEERIVSEDTEVKLLTTPTPHQLFIIKRREEK